MKKLALLFSITVALASCSTGDPKCVSFDEENYQEVIAKGSEKDLYTEAERIMLSIYFMKYAIVHEKEVNDPMIENERKVVLESGFVDHTNTCDVIAETREELKNEGITEEAYVESFRGVFDANGNLR